MKKGKRILAGIIALCMSIGPGVYLEGTEVVYAAEEVSGDYSYRELTDGTIEITRYMGHDAVLEMPGEIYGKKVVGIGERAFEDCTGLKEVSIPNGVVSIGRYAFKNDEGLEKVSIPESVTSIGEWAFGFCSLKTVNIPASVKNIEEDAFARCTKLTAINVDSENLTYASDDGILYSKDMGELLRCPEGRLTLPVIPNNVKKISNEAFFGCIGLVEINIPSGVAEIGDAAFNHCTELVEINISSGVTAIEDVTFYGCDKLTAINVDTENLTYASDDGILYSKDMEELIRCPQGRLKLLAIPDSVKEISGGAFLDCTGLVEINIPSGVTAIGDDAFYGCDKLTAINVDMGNLTYASDDGILYSKDIEELLRCPEGRLRLLVIPGSVKEISRDAFRNCTGLVEINIPSGVTAIGDEAFSGCTKLTAINVDMGNLTYASDDGILYSKDMEELLRCPEGRLKLLAISGKVKKINYSAFRHCTGLVEINIPNEVTTIENWAFAYCIGLVEINIPNGVTTIEFSAFDGCTGLVEINIPSGMTTIEAYTFRECIGLEKINIPSGMTTIEEDAFDGCENLKTVYYQGTKEQWDAIKIDTSGNDALVNAQILCQGGSSISEEVTLPETADARQELEKLKKEDVLSLEKSFQQFLSDEQIDIIESCIYTWLAEINYAYKYTGDRDIKNRIMKKAGIDPDGNFASGREQAVTHISVWTKYGPKTLEITLGLGQPDGNGSLYPSYGEMHYEILEKRSLPSDVPTSGRIGKDSYLDMETFINSAAKSSEDSLHGTFRWQELESWMAANILADKTVSEIIGNKNGCFVNGTFIVYAKPLSVYSKKVTIACPVDVHVYSMDGTEAGSIVNNEPKGGSQNVQLAVEGDTKIVYLAGDDYYLNLCGTDTGTMKYEVEEIANEEVQRNVRFLELQLKKDMQYEGYVFRPLNIDRDLYALRTVGSTSKEVFYAAEDKQKQELSLFKRVEGLTLGRGSASVDAGRTVQMSASISPMDASNPNLQWSTDNEAVAKVDSSGMVTAVGAGRATVTVSTKDGSFLKQFCVVDVVGRTNKPGGNTGTNPGGSTGINPGGSTAVTPGSDNSGSDNPGSDSSNDTTKPPLEQEPTITSLFYVLQFNANGGTGLSRATMTLLSGDSPGIMPKAKRKGYTFNGWYTQQKGGTQISGDKPLEQAATLYAQWTKVTAPAKAKAPALKSKKKGQIKVSLKKVAGAAGYQIAYSTSKQFTSAKTKTVRTSANVKTLTGLKPGRKYYVRVRAYKVDSADSRIYGTYSMVKSVKAKN